MSPAHAHPPKPARMPPLTDNIPEKLKSLDRWLVWRWVWKDKTGKWTKIPMSPHGGWGSTTNRITWGTYGEALGCVKDFDGLGFVFHGTDGIVGIDLDKCLSADGTPNPWAMDILRIAATYAEVSPSGTGVKLWVLGSLPGNGRRGTISALNGSADIGNVEIYDAGRFFTVTGRIFSAPSGEPAWSAEPVAAEWLITEIIRRLNSASRLRSADQRSTASPPPPVPVVAAEGEAPEKTLNRMRWPISAPDGSTKYDKGWGLPPECDSSLPTPEDPTFDSHPKAERQPPIDPSKPPSSNSTNSRIAWSDLQEEDRRLVHQACRTNTNFRLLWHGNIVLTASPSHPKGDPSSADYTLILHLLWWTGRDPLAADRIFRASSLMRDKWDERRGKSTYGGFTIDKAMHHTDPSLKEKGNPPADPTPQANMTPANPLIDPDPPAEPAAVFIDADIAAAHIRNIPMPATAGPDPDSTNTPPERETRPEIPHSTELHLAADAAITVLAASDHHLWSRGGTLVHVVTDPILLRGTSEEQPAIPRIAPITVNNLTERLAAHILWTNHDRRGKKRACRPPTDVAQVIYARGQWPELPAIEAVCNSPALLADGRLLTQAGYDRDTGLFITPEASALANDMPKNMSTHKALDTLSDIISDFPFTDEAHRSAWFAYLLTMIGRAAFAGNSPLFLIDANSAGSGKGLLADAAAVIATGRPAPKMSYAADDDDEVRKRITSALMCGCPNVVFDNVVGRLGNPSLDLALTTSVWQDRLLHTNTSVSIPMRITWAATGNNLSILADSARRICHCRLESPVEHPDERTGWVHPSLLNWILGNRPLLLGAAISLLKGYIKADHPNQKLPAWGGFDGWSNLIRATVVWAGLPDPRQNTQELRRMSDTSAIALTQFVERLAEAYPNRALFTVPDLLRLVAQTPGYDSGPLLPDKWADLRTAIIEFCPTRTGLLPSPRALGNAIRSVRRRVVTVNITRDGQLTSTMLMFDSGERARTGTSWRLV